MSFVTAAPEEVQAAARNLAGIRSLLAESSASAAAPTAGLVAAAEDQVSAQVAAFFGAFGEEYQVISAQAQAFHEQFVDLLSAGAGAYLSTDVANAEQNLLNAVDGPVQGLLGQASGATGAAGAAASGVTAAGSAALPILGGLGGTPVGTILGRLGGTPVGSILGGAGTPAGPSINGVVTALQNGNAVSLLSGQVGAVSQTLSGDFARLPAALTGLQNALAPELLQAGAASTSVTTIAGRLTNAVNAPVQGLLGGGAASGAAAATSTVAAAGGSIVDPYASLVTNTVSNLQSIGNTWASVTAPALLQAITMHTNPQLILTALQTGNALPIWNATGQLALGSANLFENLTVPASLSITSLNPPSLAVGVGLPELLAFDALGAPVNAGLAASLSGAAFLDAVGTGNPLAAFTAFVDAPANIANAFLNGQQTLPVPLPVPGLTADVPFSGLLAPLQPFATTTSLLGFPSVTVTGPPVGGLVPALLEYAPQLLASAFGG